MEDTKPKLRLSTPASNVGYAFARVLTSRQFATALLAAVLLSEFGVLFLTASSKRFKYDELLTFHVSSLQPFSLLWRALQTGVDGMTAGYYVIIRLGRMLPDDPFVTLRLPSILGYLMTLLGSDWFVSKRLPLSAGLAAVLLITLSPFRECALEARSYSLLVGCLAIAAVCWQRIGERRFMTALFALFLALAVSSHHLAVVTIFCFGIAELAWTLLSRRIRWRVWGACLLAAAPFFMSLPLLLHFRDVFGKHFWSLPSWSMTYLTYGDYLGLDATLALVLILFFVLMAGGSLMRGIRQPRDGIGFTLPEIVLVSGFLLYPALLVVLTKLLGSGYTSRYGWPGILGLVFGSLYLLQNIWRRPLSVYLLAALLIAFAVQGIGNFRMPRNADTARADQRWVRLAALSRSEPGVPVAIGNPMRYLEADEYAPPELRDRLRMVVDSDIATSLGWSDTPDKTNSLLAQFIPLRVESLAKFQLAHPKFILYSGGDWLTQYLVENRYHLFLLATENDGSALYVAERSER